MPFHIPTDHRCCCIAIWNSLAQCRFFTMLRPRPRPAQRKTHRRSTETVLVASEETVMELKMQFNVVAVLLSLGLVAAVVFGVV